MKPVRIQRKRTKGWNMQEASRGINGLDAVYVGRPTKWGNPFKGWDAVKQFHLWLIEGRSIVRGAYIMLEDGGAIHFPDIQIDLTDRPKLDARRQGILDHLSELRGKNLCCWCPVLDEEGKPYPCHANILLELANEGGQT